jgi:hypothetical protein
MDNYIYEALDEDNKENNDERIKDIVGSSNQDAKYKVLHTLAGYKGMLSAVWGVYSKMIENKTGKKPDERFLKAVEKDLNYGYSKLHDAIFKKDSFAAYA